MRRVWLHIAFWVLYVVQDTLLAYTWVGPAFKDIPPMKMLGIAVQAALINMPWKLTLSYFVLYVSIPRISTGLQPMNRIVTEIILVFAGCVIGYRLGSHYILYAIVYGGAIADGNTFGIANVIVATMDIGFIAGLAATIKFVRIQLAGKEREKSLIKEKLGAELKFLRNQTNPHFLLNTLNNIYGLARKKSDDTAEVVMKLSELLRFILYESSNNLITLAEEIKVIEDYLELEMIRYSDRLSVSFNKSLDGSGYRITPLLLLPFVENAFKHGISETRFESFIQIDISVKNGQLRFCIENTKDNDQHSSNGASIGLVNVKRQLELSYKDYDLKVLNEDNLFTVNLFLNLESHVEI
ncbi:MAG: sensor histidine kinase [Sphingobacteriales bacterium]|nr:sensor histidine kinase [Sphingobacteriales bacterium]